MKETIAICIILLSAACAPPATTETIADPIAVPNRSDALWQRMAGLAGRWYNALDTGSMHMYEEWTQADSLHWTGLGFVLAGADTVSIEDLRIVRSRSIAGGDAIAYGARMNTQNNGAWVDFALQDAGADTLLFTNPAHDFPKVIRYTMDNGGWRVLVKGGDRGHERQFELHYMPRPVSDPQ